MAIGARDYIDQLLVKKYSSEQVDNHDSLESMIDPEKMLDAMNDLAAVQRNMFALSQRLVDSCYALNARAARYSRGLSKFNR